MSDDRTRDAESSAATTRQQTREEDVDRVLERVRQALGGLRYGQIVITVQDGFAVQIERTEKTRLR